MNDTRLILNLKEWHIKSELWFQSQSKVDRSKVKEWDAASMIRVQPLFSRLLWCLNTSHMHCISYIIYILDIRTFIWVWVDTFSYESSQLEYNIKQKPYYYNSMYGSCVYGSCVYKNCVYGSCVYMSWVYMSCVYMSCVYISWCTGIECTRVVCTKVMCIAVVCTGVACIKNVCHRSCVYLQELWV